MHKLIRNIGFFAVLLGLGLVSCDEDYPKSHIAPYDTELLSIKITNAGADGNTVVEGTIDEDNKIIKPQAWRRPTVGRGGKVTRNPDRQVTD